MDRKSAAACVQVMMYAQLRGNNQGIIKITTGGMNRSSSAGPITVERDTRLSAVLNGKGDAGMLVLSKAAQMAAKKCKSHGFGVVGTNHTSTSTGCLAYYAENMAKQGLIGVVLAQSPEFVAPAGPIHNITSLLALQAPVRVLQHAGFPWQDARDIVAKRLLDPPENIEWGPVTSYSGVK